MGIETSPINLNASLRKNCFLLRCKSHVGNYLMTYKQHLINCYYKGKTLLPTVFSNVDVCLISTGMTKRCLCKNTEIIFVNIWIKL